MKTQSVFILDLETTGFSFNGYDRVLEIALVKLNKDFAPISSWSTLVNPKRDAGPKTIHGIESKWLITAPEFSEFAKPLFETLDTAMLIAHNASFDINFLAAEARRCGIDWEPDPERIFDSMAIAKWVVGEGKSLKLKDLCSEFGVPLRSEHSALGDALATAELIGKLVSAEASLAEMFRTLIPEQATGESDFAALQDFSKVRPDASTNLWQRSFFPALVDALPIRGNEAPESFEYLASLHRALEDSEMTLDEIRELAELAVAYELSLEEVNRIHASFFQELTDRAWADGILTDTEWSQLEYVGKTLGVSAIDLELAKTGKGFIADRPSGFLPLGLKPGDAIVLTGDMIPTKAEVTALIESAGLVVKSSISKKVRLCIAADPDSMSGKASAARRLGITVISVDMFIAQWR